MILIKILDSIHLYDFVDALFPSLKSQYQNMLSMPGFTVGESDVGIVHANLMVGADKSLRNLGATMQVAGGMMSLYLAAAIGATGVGAPLAGAIGFIGLDNLQAGIRTLTLDEATATYGAQLLEWAGVPKGYGESVYGMVDISVITKAGYAIKATNQVYNIVKVKPIAGMKPQQMVKPENISVTVENIAKNQPHVIDLKNVDDIIAGKGTTQNLPEWILDINTPNGRHYFNNINQKTTTKPLNTVIDSSVDVAEDMVAIKNGQATIKGNQIFVNGRVYEREVNGTLAPISGNGFTTLNRGEFKCLGVYNQFGNTKRAEDILNSMGMSAESKAKALEVWSKNNK